MVLYKVVFFRENILSRLLSKIISYMCSKKATKLKHASHNYFIMHYINYEVIDYAFYLDFASNPSQPRLHLLCNDIMSQIKSLIVRRYGFVGFCQQKQYFYRNFRLTSQVWSYAQPIVFVKGSSFY